MQFQLVGEIVFSREPDKVLIAGVIKNANKDLLKRGRGEGKGAEVVKYSVKGKRLLLEIQSDRHVRAHDGLLRLKKVLAQELGKTKTGVRGVGVKKYRIFLNIKPDAKIKNTLKQLPFVHSLRGENNCS